MQPTASRTKGQPAPPRIIYQALLQPNQDPARPWLVLRDGEVQPQVVEFTEPELVVWSSLWADRPGDLIRFELDEAGQGTDLTWALMASDPAPDIDRVQAMRQRLNELINAKLRHTFGQ